jgi:hypothetical protein
MHNTQDMQRQNSEFLQEYAQNRLPHKLSFIHKLLEKSVVENEIKKMVINTINSTQYLSSKYKIRNE